MESIPITRLEDLHRHLDQLSANPETPLDAALFDHVELQLTEANIPQITPRLLPKVASILQTYQNDPQVLCSLALKLLQPATFSQVLALTSEENLVAALRSPAPSANVLAITILNKAAASPAEVAILSASALLVAEFLLCWLSSPDVGVGERGIKALEELLETDCELAPSVSVNGTGGSTGAQLVRARAPGHGRLWSRLLRDRNIFGLLIGLLQGHRFNRATHPLQQSLAHGRFLRVLPSLARINFGAVASCEFPDLLPSPRNQTSGPDSLLHYATLRMVDREDPLMKLSLIDFIETLVMETRLSDYPPSSKMETLRGLLRDAAAIDRSLVESLPMLPQKTDPEDADAVRAWVTNLIPVSSTRVR